MNTDTLVLHISRDIQNITADFGENSRELTKVKDLYEDYDTDKKERRINFSNYVVRHQTTTARSWFGFGTPKQYTTSTIIDVVKTNISGFNNIEYHYNGKVFNDYDNFQAEKTMVFNSKPGDPNYLPRFTK